MELFEPQSRRTNEPLRSIATGFQSPADDYRQKALSLDELLVTCPAATFFVKVEDSGIEGIQAQDILVINKALKPKTGQVALCVVDGAFSLRRLLKRGSGWLLVTDKPGCVGTLADETMVCWGMVHAVIRVL